MSAAVEAGRPAAGRETPRSARGVGAGRLQPVRAAAHDDGAARVRAGAALLRGHHRPRAVDDRRGAARHPRARCRRRSLARRLGRPLARRLPAARAVRRARARARASCCCSRRPQDWTRPARRSGSARRSLPPRSATRSPPSPTRRGERGSPTTMPAAPGSRPGAKDSASSASSSRRCCRPGDPPTLIALFLGTLALALLVLVTRAPRATERRGDVAVSPWRALRAPLARPGFRWLLAIFVANGIAAAVPASLVLFFVDDRLQLGAQSGVLLALYFVAGACSMPRVGAPRAPLGAARDLAGRHGAGDRRVRLGVRRRTGRVRGLRADLRAVGRRARRRPRTPPGAARARDRAQRPRRGARRRVLRPVELRQQDEPRARRRPCPAGARRRSATRRARAIRRHCRRSPSPTPCCPACSSSPPPRCCCSPGAAERC